MSERFYREAEETEVGSLRDRIAITAMLAIAGRWGGNIDEISESKMAQTAEKAYQLAEAMLKARALDELAKDE